MRTVMGISIGTQGDVVSINRAAAEGPITLPAAAPMPTQIKAEVLRGLVSPEKAQEKS